MLSPSARNALSAVGGYSVGGRVFSVRGLSVNSSGGLVNLIYYSIHSFVRRVDLRQRIN